MLTKKVFVSVYPLSDIAKDRFTNIMNGLHSCQILKRDDKYYYLRSLNKMYVFKVQLKGNEHWKIEKPRRGI